MQGTSSTIQTHAAVIAWIEGGLDPAQRLEFEAHLAKCPECQAAADVLLQQRLQPPPPPVVTAPIKPELEQKKSSGSLVRNVSILVIAILILVAGFALGSWAWHLAHR
jgi:anti-sigma factor RsiW